MRALTNVWLLIFIPCRERYIGHKENINDACIRIEDKSEKSEKTLNRSASPERSEEAVSSEDESPVEPIKQERNPINGFTINGVQPFVREKSYRPISFNPQPPQPIPS
ncbi:hypothetical protein M0804_006705 [Polistes exclamans]|nr:hypothetical protein M0804_006705 [Polistes exclamans]